jgi:hypothetical protein
LVKIKSFQVETFSGLSGNYFISLVKDENEIISGKVKQPSFSDLDKHYFISLVKDENEIILG